MDEDYTTIGEKIFENKGLKYKYDYNLLTFEQAESAREVGLWKQDQEQVKGSLNDLFRSRSVDWISIIMSFLLRKIENENVMPFNPDKSHETEKFVKELPVKYKKDLEACITDFFTLYGLKHVALGLLQKGSVQMAILSTIMQQLKNNEGNKSNLSKSDNESTIVGKKAKSKGA